MRVTERHTVLDEPFGDVGGEGETGRGFGFEAFLVEDHGGDHAGECRQQHFKRVHLVEYGFLCLPAGRARRLSAGLSRWRAGQSGRR